MAGYDFDEDSLKKYLQRMDIDQTNRQAEQQGMAGSVPPPNPYADTGKKKSGGWTSILSPVMKLGGMAATALGAPYVGIPLSIAGGAVGGGGGGGGMGGALGGALKSGIGQAAGYGLGQGLDFLKSPIDDPISTGGLTIPGGRTAPIDLTSRGLTVPASPQGFMGGS